MKKIWLLTTILICWLLLTGCDKLNSEIDEMRALELAQTKEWRIELCNNKILAEVDSWATNFVWEEIIYNEWDEEDWHVDNFIYFIWSNWEDKVYGCGLGRYWKFINLYPVDQDFLNSEKYKELEELRDMLTIKDEEPAAEETLEPTYKILDWTWYVWCPWWCENWEDSEYIEWYLYQYTSPELWLKITTPINYMHSKDIFHVKYDGPLFEQIWNGIYSIENKEWEWWTYDNAESIQMFEKDPKQSLEKYIRENLLKEWCVLEVDNESLSYDENIIWAKNNTFYWMNEDLEIYNVPEPWKVKWNNCHLDKNWESTGIFIESEDWKKYYIIKKSDWCAPWPCSIFGKIEIL